MLDSSLFEYGPQQWESEPLAAFDSFLAGLRFGGRALRKSSFAIYRGMFVRLLRWAEGEKRTLFNLVETDLELFLEDRALGPETRHRYLLVFNTLFLHLDTLKAQLSEAAPQDHKASNPARELLLEAPAPERDEPAYLTRAELELFLSLLPPCENWKKARTRALIYAIAGAGLRSSEALSLNLADVHWKNGILDGIWVQAKKPRPERNAPIQPFAREALTTWFEKRQSLQIPGTRLFPSNQAGAMLQPVTLFRQIKATLAEARLVKRYEGATLLRNTCGALWLEQNATPLVMQWMGHVTLRTTELLLPVEKRTPSRHPASEGRPSAAQIKNMITDALSAGPG